MNFREHALPFDTSYSSIDDVPEDTKEILEVYDAINGNDVLDDASRVNELLDEFEDQRCFIVEPVNNEDDLAVYAVANYRSEQRSGFAWLEGLAVHSSMRRQIIVGSFAIANLVQITRESGLQEIRLQSVPSAVSFYQRNGFVVTSVDQKSGDAKMFREVR